jgi:hypothetical protein
MSRNEVHTKKPNVKAWCGYCFQFFENGPFSKVCKDHMAKDHCNLVQCKKQIFLDSECVRRFPNTNSENRHTYCVTEDDVKLWKEKCKIQNCLGNKRLSEVDYEDKEIYFSPCENSHLKNGLKKYSKFTVIKADPKLIKKIKLDESHNNIIENNTVNELNESKPSKQYTNNDIKLIYNKDRVTKLNENISINTGSIDMKEDHPESKLKNDILNLLPNMDYIDYEFNLIDKIKNLNLQKYVLDENLINDFDNFCFATKRSRSIQTDQAEEKKDRKIFEGPEEEKFGDDQNIDEIFDKVYSVTKIPRNVLNKMKSAFKKKGIFTAKILRLFKDKNRNLNCLVNDLKSTCSQIEGVALYLENML